MFSQLFFLCVRGKSFSFLCLEGGKGGGELDASEACSDFPEKQLLSFPSIFLHLKSEQTDAEVKKENRGERRKG